MAKVKSPARSRSLKEAERVIGLALWDLRPTLQDEAFIRRGGEAVSVQIENPHWDKPLKKAGQRRAEKDGSLGKEVVTLLVSSKDLPLLCRVVPPLTQGEEADTKPHPWQFSWKGTIYDSSDIKLGPDGEPRSRGELIHHLLRDAWELEKARDRELAREEGRTVDPFAIQGALRGLQMHHIDECHLNVTRANLYPVTPKQNMAEFAENKSANTREGLAPGVWRRRGGYTVNIADGRPMRNQRGEIVYAKNTGGEPLAHPRLWSQGQEANYDENGKKLKGQACFAPDQLEAANALGRKYRNKRDLAEAEQRKDLSEARSGTGVVLIDRRSRSSSLVTKKSFGTMDLDVLTSKESQQAWIDKQGLK